MLVLAKKPTYHWPVKFKTPADGGKFETTTLDLVFKRITASKLDELLKDGTDLTFCKEVVTDWKNIKDENGQDVPFSLQNLEDLLESNLTLKKVIVNAYLESHAGAPEKN